MIPPDTVTLALTFSDGTMGVMRFVTCEYDPGGRPRRTREPTEKAVGDAIARMELVLDPEKRPVVDYAFITEDDIPKDRTYRNAWRYRAEKIEVDMPAAREIHLERVRAARARMLQKKDGEWMRATGQGKKAEADRIEAERQALRDLPETLGVESANTPEELEALWSTVSWGLLCG